MLSFSLRATFCVAILSVAPAAAQRTVPTILLDKGAKELAEPFTHVNAIVELRDGRLLVGDVEQRELWLVDFARDLRTAAARIGAGPTEFQMGTLLTGAADTAVFFDLLQRRLLLFSPAGVPFATRPVGGDRSVPVSIVSAMQPRSIDAAGRLYGQTMGMKLPSTSGGEVEGAMPSFDDSTTIERLDPRTGKSETIARIRNAVASGGPKMEMTGDIMKVSLHAPNFGSTDVWAALPDGRVALFRDGDYRVEFLTPGEPAIRGPAIAHTPIPVTAADKKAVVDSTRAQVTRAMARMSQTGVKLDVEVLDPLGWPATKTPYLGVTASPDGWLWVQTPVPSGDRTAAYDVVDGAGALIARVRTAAGELIVGLGRGTVYTTRTDTDDLVYLRRYALLAPLGIAR